MNTPKNNSTPNDSATETVPTTRWIGLGQAAILLGGYTTESVRQFIIRGTLQPDGTRLRLRAVRVGKRYFVRKKWIREFIAARTEASLGSLGSSATPPSESPSKQAKRFAREQESLAKKLGRKA